MRMKRIQVTLTAGLLLLISSVAVAGATVENGLVHEVNSEVGGTYYGTIIISNKDNESQDIKIIQTDYRFRYDGTNYYGNPSENPRSNAEWITFNPVQFTIPPKGNSVVDYTIRVPKDGGLVGTYWSMCMVEAVPKDEADESDLPRGSIMMRSIFRTGIQMRVNIGNPGGTHELTFLDAELVRENSARTLHVDIENVGEIFLSPSLSVELYDMKGKITGTFTGNKRGIYPETSKRFTVDLSDVPQGKYKALIIADCGGDYVFGADYTLNFKK